ncbi:hypothetical protein COL922a_010950 [Colletotrichum nupharicola]|nr:hypothetical protein COL922a_010950 [Colletotrichum nupharicola]
MVIVKKEKKTKEGGGGGDEDNDFILIPFICFGCFPGGFPPKISIEFKLPEFCIKILWFEIGNCPSDDGKKGGDDSNDDDDDDDDDDNDDDSEDGSDEEDKAVSFDEAEFSRMMREMMGLAPNNQGEASPPAGTRKHREGFPEDPSDEDLRELAAQLEAELTEHGALRLDVSDNSKAPAVKGKDSHRANVNGLGTAVKHNGSDDEDDKEAGDEEIDIDYNLAKNLLESFKGQAGLPGPAGNILGMMGMQLPRDEADGDAKSKK